MLYSDYICGRVDIMDDKGYVLSGLGLLLIIPVMILIPIALSVTNQSADLPNTFVKSDSSFYANNNIQNDMSIKLSDFLDTVSDQNSPYQQTDSNLLAQQISTLYATTNTNYYLQNNNFGMDNINITPMYPPNQHLEIRYKTDPNLPPDLLSNPMLPNLPSNLPVYGSFLLSNGINITYQIINPSYKQGNDYFYVYAFSPTINASITTVKNDSGLNQTFVDANNTGNLTIELNNNNPSNVNTFFNSLNTSLTPLLY